MSAAPSKSDARLAELARAVRAAPVIEPERGGAGALFVSAVLHALVIGLVVIVGLRVVEETRRAPAPLMVADWTPPPLPAAVADAPPSLPLPGGGTLHAGPASRARTDANTAARQAAARLAQLEPDHTPTLARPPARLAQTLGFGGAPAGAPRGAGFAADRERVAFVIDAGGPMVGTLQAAVAETARRLAQLSPQQRYVVVVVRGDGCETVPGTPAPATRASIERTVRWLTERTQPQGRADLGAGLECAWQALDPDAVCLIARGNARPPRRGQTAPGATDTLVIAADRLNPPVAGKRKAVMLCVELLDGPPDSPLRAVGRTHGGAQGYQLLTREDLGLTPKPAPPRPR